MAEKYYSILTNRGKELEAQSSATGKPVIIKDFVVGDGNGQAVKPDPAQTKLVREVYRNAISALQVSPDQANQFIAQLVLSENVGGFVVREVGLLTDAGELYSVANCAAIEKPENGVSINLQYRLAVSETASIELKVATGDGLFLRQDANLSDVKDAALSRKSLGLKGAAILDVGKAANTVAAGDDTRIVNALQKNNNLSELTDKAKARSNLELKTAAQKDVVTSKTDVTADRVLTTGWMSLGGYGTDNLIAGADAKKSLRNGFYGVQSEPTYGNAAVISFGYDSGSQVHIIAGQGGQAPFLGVCGSTPQGAFGNWGKIYTEFQKPTAGDVGALPIGGGRLTGNIEIYSAAPILQLTESDTGKKYFIVADGSGFRINEDSTAGNVILSYAGAGKQLKTVGQFVPSDYANFDARYYTKAQSDAGYMPKTGAYTKAESDGRFQPKGNYTPAGEAYTKAESDTRYQPKGSYTPAGQAYTKAESDSRFQKINTASLAANGWFRDTNTGMLIQYGKVAVTTDGQSFTFPVAFSLVPTLALTVNGGAYGDVGASSISTTGFTVKASTKNTVGFIAIGK